MSTMQTSTKAPSWANIVRNSVPQGQSTLGVKKSGEGKIPGFGANKSRRFVDPKKGEVHGSWNMQLARVTQKVREEELFAKELHDQKYEEMCRASRSVREAFLNEGDDDGNVCSYCRRCGRRGGAEAVGLGNCCDGYWVSIM